MKKVNTYKEFVNETSALQPQEVDVTKFPNPVTSALKRIFQEKGWDDGDMNDDMIKAKKVSIPAKDLKPSQDAIYLSKALGMAVGGVEGGELGAIISNDNYILDGHHRWAATMFNNPNAKIIGTKVDLPIGDLVPVLRALGDVFGNSRRGEPKGGDTNIFKASIKDALAAVQSGANMNPKFFDQDKADKWLEGKGGEKTVQKSLAMIQSTPPPSDAPPRSEMPVIDADKGEDKKAADLLKKGKLDVKAPYSTNESKISKLYEGAVNEYQKDVSTPYFRELVPRMEGIVDRTQYKKFTASMDKLLDDWYAEGFDKGDVLNFLNAILPDGPND